MCLLSAFLHQQSAFAEYDISFYQNDNRCTYYAHFELPNFTIADTSLYALDSNGDATNTILYSTICGLDSMTWLCLKSGTPSLPCYTITLPITKDASNFELTRILERGDSIKSLVLSRQLYPEGYPDVQPNNDYYNCDENIVIQPFVVDTFTTYGLDGVTIAICPFAYIPKSNKLYYQPVIDFQFSFATSTEQFGNKEKADSAACKHVISLFDFIPNSNLGAKGQPEEKDFWIKFFSLLRAISGDGISLTGTSTDYITCVEEYRYSTNAEHTENRDTKILVVSHKKYVQKMKDYTMYKRYQGYTVGLVSSDSSLIKKEYLKKYLLSLAMFGCKPNYVLLVGDKQEIECYGENGDPHNPESDFPYCYSGDYTGHIEYHIGRFFPRLNVVDTIIYRTMCSEQNYTKFNKYVLKVTGSGNGMGFGQFALKTVEFKGISEYHCNQPSSKFTFEDYIDIRPYWLLLYNGHGNEGYTFPYGVGIKWDKWYAKRRYLTESIYPMMFFQACETGCYKNYGFGNLAHNKLCSIYIGASTLTGARWGQLLINKGFDNGDNTAWTNEEHIGDFLDETKRMSYEGKSSNRNENPKVLVWLTGKLEDLGLIESGLDDDNYSNAKDGVRRFNLFGDPSFLYRGLSFENLTFETENWYSKLYYRAKTINTGDGTKVNCMQGSDVKLVASEKISLKPGFKVESGAKFKAEIVKKYSYEKEN